MYSDQIVSDAQQCLTDYFHIVREEQVEVLEYGAGRLFSMGITAALAEPESECRKHLCRKRARNDFRVGLELLALLHG